MKASSKPKISPRVLRNINWIESMCCVPDGRLVGQKVKLSPAQRDWMEMIYGSPTRTFILSIPRKNAKTTTSAFLMLLHLVGPEAVPNGNAYSAAQSREQAAILFGLAAKIVRMSPDLSQYVSIKESAKTMICAELGTVYKALSAEASTAFGLSTSIVFHDELGQVRGPRSELYEALETASAAQESPLTIVISTQAPSPNDLLSLLIADAQTKADPRIKCVVYQVPEEADVFDPEEIAKAQPNWHLMNQSEVLKMAADAKRMPSREASFRNYICNQQVEATDPFVSRSVWQGCGAMPDGDMRDKRLFIGLDLSSVSDLTALVAVSTEGDVYSTFWLPAEGLVEKSRADRVPYDMWAEQGFLDVCPGKSIEYEFIAHHLRELFDTCSVECVAFDRYNMRFLKPWLEKVGFTPEELERFIEFGQGFVSMSPALRELESRLLNGQLKHGNHPVLAMCASNATVVQDPAENRKFVKTRASGRIDGLVALAMAIGAMPSLIELENIDSFIYNPISG